MADDVSTDDAEPTPEKKKKPGRKKGTPKTGGRQKGTPNRNSATVRAALDKAGIPLVEFIIAEIACLDTTQERLREYKSLMAYCYPRLKMIESNPFAPPPSEPPLGILPPPPQAAPAAPASKVDRLKTIHGTTTPKSG